MNNNYKPLFILKNFCEEFHPIGSQVRIFIDALKNAGINPTIYAKFINNTDSIITKYDINLINEIPHKFIKTVIRRILPDLILLPDIERFTYLPLLDKKIKKLGIEKLSYDWIHTVSNPCSNHLLGLNIKKKYGIMWVAHFYDPWVDNCYRNFKTDFFKKYDEKLELYVAINADVIIHTNETVKEKWIQRYGELVSKKIFVMPICYEENMKIDINYEKQLNDKKLTILYVGGLYLDRNLNNIINAIKILKKEISNLEDKLVFKIIGSSSHQIKENVKKEELDKMILFLGYKPHNQLSTFYNEADVLLVIDAPFKENIFFPSKLIEYLRYNKPVLGITPCQGVTHDILIESGHTAIENENENEIANYLRKMIMNKSEKQIFKKDFYKRFSIDTNTSIFLDFMKNKLSNF